MPLPGNVPLQFSPSEARSETVRQYWRKDTFKGRRALPDGPWMNEPDKVQWLDETTGLPCLIVRNGLGALCGYAGVYPGHPMHGRHYDHCDLRAHGGLTFSGACSEGPDESLGVCHIPEPGTPEHVWWMGFDCAHSFDLAPGMSYFGFQSGEVYRDITYVKAEVQRLALQLAGMS